MYGQHHSAVHASACRPEGLLDFWTLFIVYFFKRKQCCAKCAVLSGQKSNSGEAPTELGPIRRARKGNAKYRRT